MKVAWVWYCCWCRQGPLSAANNAHCSTCYRQRCNQCRTETSRISGCSSSRTAAVPALQQTPSPAFEAPSHNIPRDRATDSSDSGPSIDHKADHARIRTATSANDEDSLDRMLEEFLFFPDDEETTPEHSDTHMLVDEGLPSQLATSAGKVASPDLGEKVLLTVEDPEIFSATGRLEKDDATTVVMGEDIHSSTTTAILPDMYGSISPQLQPGKVRIWFTCACGVLIWDDYEKCQERAAEKLEKELNRFFQQCANNSTPTRPGSNSSSISSIASRCTQVFSNIVGWLSSFRNNPQTRIDTEQSAGADSRSDSGKLDFYLTCRKRNARIPNLVQFPAAYITTDLEYFDMLRGIGRPKPWSLLWLLNVRKLVAIQYIKFVLLWDNKHVEVRLCPDLPRDKDQYQPCEQDFDEKHDILPWGSNLLLHFYEKRHECSQHPRVLPLIPRKLRGSLVVENGFAPKAGWGMQLTHGIDTFRVGILGMVGLVLSSFFGILWAKLHANDIQGGTGLTQCLMVFVSFLVTLLGLVGFVEQHQ